MTAVFSSYQYETIRLETFVYSVTFYIELTNPEL